jgi:hypothetical protein
MKRVLVILLTAIVGIVILAQTGSSQNSQRDSTASPPYQPAVPVAPQVYGGGGGWGWGYGGSGGGTAAGNAMQGMASVVNAAGNYNLSTSAAAINMTQAQKQGIQNWASFTDTYFDLRARNRQEAAAMRGKPVSEEYMHRVAQAGAPKPLGSQQLDPVSGEIFWPDVLQDDQFREQRDTLQAAFAERAKLGSVPLEGRRKAKAATEAMLDVLGSMIRDLDPQAYMSAKQFIQSLAFEVGRPLA